MNWPQLLNWHRHRDTRRWPIDPARSPWQIDFDRLIFSSAFRRLQDKTQVFPLSGSDYVRTRLTHTLEVSTVARTLGTMAGALILDRHKGADVDNAGTVKKLGDLITPADIGAIVAAAALAHDLGNPPFGHSGEDAVRYWFKTSSSIAEAKTFLSPEQVSDLTSWEGNAQGFRLLTKYQMYRTGGMRLSNATLAAFNKYPCSAFDVQQNRGISRKKFGFFSAEIEDFQEVAHATGLIRRESAKNGWCRHPLAFLVEAADDIVNRIVDLEDGVRYHGVDAVKAESLLKSIPTKLDESHLNDAGDKFGRIRYLRAVCIRELAERVREVFEANEMSMLEGAFDEDLVSLIPQAKVLTEVQDELRKTVYLNRQVLEIEAAGFQIIPGLLDLFWLATGGKDQDTALRSRKVLQLLPLEYVEIAESDQRIYNQMLRTMDYISGMTDGYAIDLYRKLNGMTLPS